MPTEKFANNATSTLSANITNVATSLTLAVGGGAKFPANGQFRIIIDSEIITVGARSTDTLSSLTRGVEGTTAASHNSGAVVTLIVTSGSIDQMRKDLIQSGTDAAKPASEREGILYLPNNGLYVYRDSGTLLEPWGPLLKFVKPIAADFTDVNMTGASIITTQGPLILKIPPATSFSWRIQKKAAPATPYKISAAFALMPSGDGDSFGGLCFRESSTGKLHGFMFLVSAANADLQLARYDDPNTGAGAPQFTKNRPLATQHGLVWLRIEDDGTNLKYYFSFDGQNWSEALVTESRTVHMAGGPNEVGWMGTHAGAPSGTSPHLYLFSWEQG